MKSKFDIIDYSILITIASTTLYIVFRNLGRELGSFAFLWAPITILLILYGKANILKNKVIKLLLFYGVIFIGILHKFLWGHMSEWNFNIIVYEFYYLFVFTLIFIYYASKNEFIKLAWLSKWALLFVLISLIGTNIALNIDPNLVRESARTGKFTDDQGVLFKITGAMGYSYAQGIICLIPILIYFIKNKSQIVFSKWLLIAILFLILITEIRAQVFANLLITILITFLSIFGHKKKKLSLILFAIVGVFFMINPDNFLADFFILISNYFDKSSIIYDKLIDFSMFLKNSDLDNSSEAGSRASRYPLLFDAFSSNPIFGDASYNSPHRISGGAHVYWMNRLTIWGLPGFLIYVFLLFRIFKMVYFTFDANYKFYYLLSILSVLLLGLLKAIGGREIWLMLIIVIPGLFYLPLLKRGVQSK